MNLQDEFYKNPMYYGLGHFSKFIPEGSVVIDLAKEGADRSYNYNKKMNI